MNLPAEINTTDELKGLKVIVEGGEITAALLRQLISLQERSVEEVKAGIDELIKFATRRYSKRLTPQYHAVPWSNLIIEHDEFSKIFEATVELVDDFSALTPEKTSLVLQEYPQSLMVFRLITGYTRGELADIVYSKLEQAVGETKLKQFEAAEELSEIPGKNLEEVCDTLGKAIVEIVDGSLMPLPKELDPQDFRSRQYKVDTLEGWRSVADCVNGGISFVDLLYERYTGRPFAYVRDALSEKKGDILEKALEKLLKQHNIPYDRINDNSMPDFVQAADFAIPDRHNPKVVIEAKLCEDGGTARDKASRIERLKNPCEERGITLVALVDGKGFRRFEDVLLPIVKNTNGHTYFLENIEEMLDILI